MSQKIQALLGLFILVSLMACDRGFSPSESVDQPPPDVLETSKERPSLTPPDGVKAQCGEKLRVASFNLESGGADLEYLLQDMAEFGKGVQIWGFQEVYDWWKEPLLEGLSLLNEAEFAGVLSQSGRSNRLLIAYNSDVLRLDDYQELEWIQLGNQLRAPLYAEFTVRESGIRFGFINNHLIRTDPNRRYEQARLLNEWGRQRHDQPTIAVGDYNFDWELDHDRNDPGFEFMTVDDVFVWLRPGIKVQTQCNPWYNSILDFIFLGGRAQNWLGSSKIKFHQEAYCAPNQRRSDHRPITAVLEPCHA